MARSIFGWDYPPGCSGTPYDESEAIDLADGKTLKGYGRSQHGLNGKDADLDRCGQIAIYSAWWLDDGTITIEGSRYATVCSDPDWTEDQLDEATECVCGCDIPGEWDGDGWVLSEKFHIKFDHPWPDDASDEDAIKSAIAAAYEAIDKDSAHFEDELGLLHDALDRIGKA